MMINKIEEMIKRVVLIIIFYIFKFTGLLKFHDILFNYIRKKKSEVYDYNVNILHKSDKEALDISLKSYNYIFKIITICIVIITIIAIKYY